MVKRLSLARHPLLAVVLNYQPFAPNPPPTLNLSLPRLRTRCLQQDLAWCNLRQQNKSLKLNLRISSMARVLLQNQLILLKIWNPSRSCVSSLSRGQIFAINPILIYVLLQQTGLDNTTLWALKLCHKQGSLLIVMGLNYRCFSPSPPYNDVVPDASSSTYLHVTWVSRKEVQLQPYIMTVIWRCCCTVT